MRGKALRIGRKHHGSTDGVLGLAHAAGAWALVALEGRDDDAPREVHHARADAGYDALDTVWARLTSGLDERQKRWPIALALPTGRTLHRRIELPDADAETTAQLVAVRAEAWLPGHGGEVLYGWEGPDERGAAGRAPGRWVTAVPRDAVAPVEAALSRLGGAAGVLSYAASDATAWSAGLDARGTTLLVAPGATQTAAVLTDGSRLLAVANVDGTPTESPSVWLADLEDALLTMRGEPGVGGNGAWPVTWAGAGVNDRETGAWAEALGLRHLKVVNASPDQCLARGAARAALGATWPTVVMDDPAARNAVKPVSVKAWVAAGVALAAALGLWAWSDLNAAAAIEAARDQHPTLRQEQAELTRQLSLYEFLEKRPPTVLAMLDEFTDKASGFNFKVMHYDADGDLELTGVLNSANAIGTFVSELSQMRTLDSAQLRSQKNEGRDQVAYEIVAKPSTRFFEAFVPAPRPAAQADAGDTKSDPEDGASVAANAGEPALPTAQSTPDAAASEDEPDAPSETVETAVTSSPAATPASAEPAGTASAPTIQFDGELNLQNGELSLQGGELNFQEGELSLPNGVAP